MGLCSLRAFAGIARRRAFRASIASIAVGVARALNPLCKIEAPAATARPTASTTRRRMRVPRFIITFHGSRALLMPATGFDVRYCTGVCQFSCQSRDRRVRNRVVDMSVNGCHLRPVDSTLDSANWQPLWYDTFRWLVAEPSRFRLVYEHCRTT